MGKKKTQENAVLPQNALDEQSKLFARLYGAPDNLGGEVSSGLQFGALSGSQSDRLAEKPETLDASVVLADFFDMLDFQRKQRGNLLGSFSDGEYSIGEQMRQQLLLLPKKFESLEDSTAWASAKLGSFVINFKVVFDISNTFCGAKLFLIETESDVDENVKHVSLLDEVLQLYDYYFRDEMFKKWNIFRDEQSLAKTSVVQTYLQLQQDDVHFGRELNELLAQLYLVRMLQFLNTLGEKGEKARKEFAEVVASRLQQEPAFSQEFATQKMLLDNILIEHDIFDEVAKSQEGLKILQAYTKPLQHFRETRTEVISEKMELGKNGNAKDASAKQENSTGKDAEKKAGGKSEKGGGGSGSGGSGGGGGKGDVKVNPFNMKDVKPLNIGGGVTRIGGAGGAARTNTPAAASPQTTAQTRTAGATGAAGAAPGGIGAGGTASGTTGAARTNAAQNTANGATNQPGAQVAAQTAAAQPNAQAPQQTSQSPQTQSAQSAQPTQQQAQSTQQQKEQNTFSMGGALAMAQALVADEENDSQLNMQQGGLANSNLPFDELKKEGSQRPKQPEIERGL